METKDFLESLLVFSNNDLDEKIKTFLFPRIVWSFLEMEKLKLCIDFLERQKSIIQDFSMITAKKEKFLCFYFLGYVNIYKKEFREALKCFEMCWKIKKLEIVRNKIVFLSVTLGLKINLKGKLQKLKNFENFENYYQKEKNEKKYKGLLKDYTYYEGSGTIADYSYLRPEAFIGGYSALILSEYLPRKKVVAVLKFLKENRIEIISLSVFQKIISRICERRIDVRCALLKLIDEKNIKGIFSENFCYFKFEGFIY